MQAVATYQTAPTSAGVQASAAPNPPASQKRSKGKKKATQGSASFASGGGNSAPPSGLGQGTYRQAYVEEGGEAVSVAFDVRSFGKESADITLRIYLISGRRTPAARCTLRRTSVAHRIPRRTSVAHRIPIPALPPPPAPRIQFLMVLPPCLRATTSALLYSTLCRSCTPSTDE